MLRDLRDKLPRAGWSIGHRHGSPTGATLHYNGPPVSLFGNPAGELAQLAADARYHMRPDVLGADGIQYTYAILSNGERCQLRDETAILWHSANAVGNNQHLAIHLPLGGAQRPTDAQWQAATLLFDELIGRYHWSGRSVILGHREWPSSDGKPQKSCPGPIVFRQLQLWRGALPPQTITRYRVRFPFPIVNVRQGPGVQYKVAGVMHAGDLVAADAVVMGVAPPTSADLRWLHRQDGLGFVHMSLVEPV
jgi:hypothetical protein